MNDFTKEELEDIKSKYEFLSIIEPYSLEHLKFIRNLTGKIKSMIDNYCEHEFYLNGCGEGIYAQCHKCGQISRVVIE